MYTWYLCIGDMQLNILDHVCGRYNLWWNTLTSSYTLSSAEVTVVLLAGQSSEEVPDLPSHSIHNPSMTSLNPHLSIASLAGKLAGKLAGLLLTSDAGSEDLRIICRQFLTLAMVARSV